MRTYVFTYFTENYTPCEFRVNANRFAQAFDSFCLQLSVLPKNIKIAGFSHSYRVVSDSKSRCCFLTYNRLIALEAIKVERNEN